MDPSVVETGAIGIAMLVLYALIDKVVVPLIKARNGGRSGNDTQNFINRQTDVRLDRNEKEISEIRASVAEVSMNVGVSKAILERVEKLVDK